MCREWHAPLLLSLSCWLGLSTMGPYYRPLRYKAPQKKMNWRLILEIRAVGSLYAHLHGHCG